MSSVERLNDWLLRFWFLFRLCHWSAPFLNVPLGDGGLIGGDFGAPLCLVNVMRREYLLLLAIIAVGFVLRIIAIDKWPLWSDEAMTLLIAQWPYRSLFLVPVDTTPGLYYALHKLFLGPDVGVIGARSISLVAGTLTIPAAYFFAKAAKIPALLTAAFVALSFPLIDYSQEARAYALLVLIITCSAWAFVSRRWLIFALTCVLAFYTHPIAAFWIGPASVVAMTDRKAWLPLGLAFILAMPEAMRLLAYGGPSFDWLPHATPIQALTILGLSLLPAILAVTFIRRVEFGNELTPYALGILVAAPVLIWLVGFAKPMFMERTILFAIPGYLALLALALRPQFRLAAVGIFAACLVFTGTVRPKEDWRTVANASHPILCEPRQAAAFRHASGRNGPVVLRYNNREVIVSGSMRDYFRTLSKAEFVEVETNGAKCLRVKDRGRTI